MAAKGTFKVEFLKEMERKVQAEWEEERVFEEDAPQKPDPSSKYMVTFPFPYMNGLLHLGHTFTITRVSDPLPELFNCTNSMYKHPTDDTVRTCREEYHLHTYC